MDTRLVAKRKQHLPDRRDERGVVSTGQIRATDRPGKERVADKQIQSFALRLFRRSRQGPRRDLQADAPGAVSWRVMRTGLEVAE